jgi:hypothetical protein
MWPSLSPYKVGTPGEVIALRGPFGIGAQWLACVCPCQRFTRSVTRAGAGLWVKMVRYSFLVRLFHPLLSAGFDRRFQDVPRIAQILSVAIRADRMISVRRMTSWQKVNPM